MKVKVCGMRDPDNIFRIASLSPDYMGFIFYRLSPRYVGNIDRSVLRQLPEAITKVGVFVNEPIDGIRAVAETYGIDTLQLHGDESPEQCRFLAEKGYDVIKVVNIKFPADIDHTDEYEEYCRYLLFDTKTNQYGGSGKQFEWSLLSRYNGKLPFFLSGGITIKDLQKIKEFTHPLIEAVDINSRFETAQGVKDDKLVYKFIKNLN